MYTQTWISVYVHLEEAIGTAKLICHLNLGYNSRAYVVANQLNYQRSPHK